MGEVVRSKELLNGVFVAAGKRGIRKVWDFKSPASPSTEDNDLARLCWI